MTHIHDQEDAVVFAECRALSFAKEVSTDELQRRITSFILDLSTALREKGCKLIGHIKGKIDLGDGGQLFFNATNFAQEPSFRGDIEGSALNADMSINVIVYGISKEDVSRIYESSFSALCIH